MRTREQRPRAAKALGKNGGTARAAKMTPVRRNPRSNCRGAADGARVEAEVTRRLNAFDMAEDPRGLAADDHIPSRVLARRLLGFRPSHRRGPLGKTPILTTDAIAELPRTL